MMMIGKEEHMSYLVCQIGIDAVIHSAREQADRENVTFTGPTDADVIQILAAKIVALNEWGMWTLSPDDVQIRAKQVAGRRLTPDEVQDVRHYFRKGFEANQCNWSEILEQAIEEVTG